MPTTPDRPADQLHAAAEKLREEAARAHRASPAPWTATDEHVVRCADRMIVADRSETDHPAERADLPYIALMHPGVGLALAAWLEWQGRAVADGRIAVPDVALAVARQLLNGNGTGEDTTAVDAIGLCGYCGVPRETHHHGYVSTAAALAAAPHHIPAAPPAPADRAAFEALAAEWEKRGEYGDSSITDRARELRAVLAGEAAAGAHQTEQAQPVPEPEETR
ncbi:hypothetical protein [Streptomyces rubiginosohelvolus]|uniref:hypothetical protein n=1 Tax=Streptomyces rubiginosohelvolus TaxID=67362 RepID=UPI0033F14015